MKLETYRKYCSNSTSCQDGTFLPAITIGDSYYNDYVKKTKMSPRKPQKNLSEAAKNELIEQYRNTSISQRDVAEKFDVSKTQVQKIIDQNKVVKLVRPTKKRKQKNYDRSDAGADSRTDSIKEFSSMEEMARFAVESPDKIVPNEMVFESRRKCLYYRNEENMFQIGNICL